MQQLDGRYFYLYRFYDGRALRGEEITADHCRSIGRAMAAIHAVDRRDAGCGLEPINVDWRQYAGKLDGELDALLRKAIPLLCRMQYEGNSAISRIPPVQTICHGDLDPKNVMWRGEDFRIIDLECLGYASPYLELYEQALCWSGYEQLDIDFTKFSALVGAYLDGGGQLPDDREALYYANFSRLEWLKYNIERALGVGCEPEEIALGASQAAGTLKLFEYYHRAKDSILDCLNSL